jgi:hypothetical protein
MDKTIDRKLLKEGYQSSGQNPIPAGSAQLLESIR